MSERKKAIEDVLRRIQHRWPRMQVALILALTGVAAFLTSAVLLRFAGVTQMSIRYPVAIAVGYGFFILLIGIWLWTQADPTDIIDIPDTADFPLHRVVDTNIGFSNSGSTGGGSAPVHSAGSGSYIDLPGVDFDLDLDDAIWIVLALIVLIAGLLAIFYVVYIAPALLAEVLLDGLLAGGLYKTVKNVEPGSWLTTVLRKTAIPAALAMIFFGIFGFVVQLIEPDAASMGEAWRLMSR